MAGGLPEIFLGEILQVGVKQEVVPIGGHVEVPHLKGQSRSRPQEIEDQSQDRELFQGNSLKIKLWRGLRPARRRWS